MANVGFYGKIPAQGDFVRVNAADPVCIAFDQWLAEGIDTMQRGGITPPSEPVQFVFRAPGAKTAMVGAFVPSHDSVGRSYPMVVFALVDLATIAPRYPGVPVVFTSFLTAANQVLFQGPQITAARLSEQVRALMSPSPQDFGVGDQVCRRTLDATPAGDVIRRLFVDPSQGKHYYAFRTFLNACESVRGKEPAKTNVTLDCPLGGDVDLFTWLELSRRVLRWSQPPSFFWTEGATPRLLLPLGPAPAATLVYLARPDHGGAKLWPVTTDRADAVEAARQQIAPNHRRSLDEPSTTLEALLASLST